MPLNQSQDDAQLLRNMRAGDSAAFAALYLRHADAVYRYGLMRSASHHTASDAVQDSFLVLIAPTCSFDPLKGTLQAFLFGVTRNLLLKRNAGERRHASLDGEGDEDDDAGWLAVMPAPGFDPQERMLRDESADAVRLALQGLAPHYRDVMILYELHDLSYAEIAQVCAIDIGTVRSRLSRGREKLAAALRLAGYAPERAQYG